jgi:hypothetical protein
VTERQGDFFDPVQKAEDALEDHVKDVHGGDAGPGLACAECRRLASTVADVAEKYEGTWRYSGEGTCRYCPAEVLWFRTPTQALMPLDRDLFLASDPKLQRPNALRGLWATARRGRATILPYNHWGTCPNAEKARKDGGRWYERVPDTPTRDAGEEV